MKAVVNGAKSVRPLALQADFFDGTAARKIEQGARIIPIDRRLERDSYHGTEEAKHRNIGVGSDRFTAQNQPESAATLCDDLAFSMRAFGASELFAPCETESAGAFAHDVVSIPKLAAAAIVSFFLGVLIVML